MSIHTTIEVKPNTFTIYLLVSLLYCALCVFSFNFVTFECWDISILLVLMKVIGPNVCGFHVVINVVLYYYRFPLEVKEYVKQKCLHSIGDSSPLIRATVGLVISMIANMGKLAHWPELLSSLCQFIESPDQLICEVKITFLLYCTVCGYL